MFLNPLEPLRLRPPRQKRQMSLTTLDRATYGLFSGRDMDPIRDSGFAKIVGGVKKVAAFGL